ncbi:MAG: RCC1 domain-containing protein [Paludibaculum sp.]
MAIFAVQASSAQHVSLLQKQPGQGPAQYAVQPLGEVDGARKVALPEAGGHVLVLTTQGRVYGWGQNASGQLGAASRSGWSEVDGLSGVAAIAAGAAFPGAEGRRHGLGLGREFRGSVRGWDAGCEIAAGGGGWAA